MVFRLWPLVILLFPLRGFAEYRVFLIQELSPEGELVREWPSRLDPEQLRPFHSLPQGHRLTYVQTWMCPGDTSHQPLCSNPAPEELEEPEPVSPLPSPPST